jgi:solute carrier family 13 (sodium-dependent dicarboxylate transporter), member 2/3/5
MRNRGDVPSPAVHEAAPDPPWRCRGVAGHDELGPLPRCNRSSSTRCRVRSTSTGGVGFVLDPLPFVRLVVAIVAASLLFVLPLDRRLGGFTLTWRQAVAIDWGTIVLFGAGIALGSLLSSTGLAALIGSGLAESLGAASPFTLTLLAVMAAVLISETTSNTASVGIVVPIVISLARAAGMDPAVPALAAIFGASFGFMLPVSTPPNAIVYGSGMVPITRMIRSGFVFDIIGAIIIAVGVTVMASLVGLR